jgi:hypothetical protein
MKAGDKDKLNQCLDILDTTDLGLSLVWLWTWSTIKNLMQDGEWECTQTEAQMWDNLCEAVEAGHGFSLEYGAEQHYEDVMEWMTSRDYLIDPEDIEEEEE